MFHPYISTAAERRLLGLNAPPEGTPGPALPSEPRTLEGMSRRALGQTLRASVGNPERRQAIYNEIDRRRANDAAFTASVAPAADQPANNRRHPIGVDQNGNFVYGPPRPGEDLAPHDMPTGIDQNGVPFFGPRRTTPLPPVPRPVPLPGPDLPPGTVLPGNTGGPGNRPRTGSFTPGVPFRPNPTPTSIPTPRPGFTPGSLPFRPGTLPTATPRVTPRSVPTPRVEPTPAPRGPASVERLGTARRLTYGAAAQTFIASRLAYVTSELEDPASSWRTRARTIRTIDSTLDANLTDTRGIKIEKTPGVGGAAATYLLTWTEGVTVTTWRITEPVVSGGLGGRYICFSNTADPLMQSTSGMIDAFPAGTVSPDRIKAILRAAQSRRASETADNARVAAFDLPRGEPILYTGVFDATDPTEENHARHFGSFLGQANGGAYNVVGAGNDTFAATNDLLGRLEARFDGALAQGIKNHYLYFSVHGSENRIGFDLPGGGRITLEPRELMALFRLPKYNQCRFTLRMNCCNSGGFRSGEMADLFRAPGEEGRISVFIQSKQELPNPIRSTEPRDIDATAPRGRNFDTPYDYYLVHFLSRGMTYGQAHLAADRATKTNFPGVDAGVFRSGVLDGSETADPRTPLRPDRIPERLDGLGRDELYT